MSIIPQQHMLTVQWFIWIEAELAWIYPQHFLVISETVGFIFPCTNHQDERHFPLSLENGSKHKWAFTSGMMENESVFKYLKSNVPLPFGHKWESRLVCQILPWVSCHHTSWLSTFSSNPGEGLALTTFACLHAALPGMSVLCHHKPRMTEQWCRATCRTCFKNKETIAGPNSQHLHQAQTGEIPTKRNQEGEIPT